LKKQKTSSKTQENYSLEEKEAFTLPIETLEEKLKTNLKTGLTQLEAEERLKSNGPNIIPKVKSRLIRAYFAPLLNWLITIYLIVSTVLGLFALFLLPQVWSQVAQWLLVITVNIVIIVVQQVRAQSEFTSLQKLSATKSRVLRDGTLIEIASEKLVPGDIIRLVQGDRIPTDARIVEASSLMVNEATLTGESNDVEKFGGETLRQNTSSGFSKTNMLFLGTFVITGTATALVVETGRFTQLGKMSKKLQELNVIEIPLRKRLNKLAKYLSIIILLYLSISIAYNIIRLYLTNNISNATLVATAITRSLTTALSIMPINIPLLVTIVLLTGALAMAQHKVITRNLNSIETLGRVSVVCTDKTGTITQNHMIVKWIYIPTKQITQLYYATGTDLKPQDKIVSVYSHQSIEKALENQRDYQNGKPTTITPETPLEYLLISATLNNDSLIVEEEKDQNQKESTRAITGDATDTALALLFKKSRLQEQTYRSRFKIVKKWPFDSKLKKMTTVFKDAKNRQYILFTKGATEILLTESNYVLNEKGEAQTFTQNEKTEVEKNVKLFSRLGQRVISFAFRKIDKFDPEEKRESIENDLIYLGFVSITDPPREGVRESVTELKNAGVKPIMITGDSAATAESIAREVGIMEEGNLVAEGSAIQDLSDEGFRRTSVFARISPEDKMGIVARYKRQNCVVAMTGDGVNDAQAILTADVGIAMGAGGTDVARQAADIVLADDSFNSVVTGIREGRGVFEKIQNVVFFYIAVNLAEAMVYFGSSFVPGFFLLNPWQQIYIFATAHSVPPFALVIDRLNKDAMKEKPRNNEDLISGYRKTALVIFALSLAIMLSVSYILPFSGVLPVFDGNKVGFTPNLSQANQLDSVSWAHAKARTMLQSVALVAECALILSLRRIKKPIHKSLREDANWIVWPFMLAIPIFHVLLMYLPATQLFLLSFGVNFEIIQFTGIDWIIVLALGLTPIALLESSKVWSLKKKL
jgi:Ca2+-transporting ATPase